MNLISHKLIFHSFTLVSAGIFLLFCEGCSAHRVLKVSALHCTRDSIGFITVTGQVENISNMPLKLWVTGEFYTGSGKYVSQNGTDTSYNPVMPKQSSPFTMHETANPEIATVKIGFEHYINNNSKLNAIGKLTTQCSFSN